LGTINRKGNNHEIPGATTNKTWMDYGEGKEIRVQRHCRGRARSALIGSRVRLQIGWAGSAKGTQKGGPAVSLFRTLRGKKKNALNGRGGENGFIGDMLGKEVKTVSEQLARRSGTTHNRKPIHHKIQVRVAIQKNKAKPVSGPPGHATMCGEKRRWKRLNCHRGW